MAKFFEPEALANIREAIDGWLETISFSTASNLPRHFRFQITGSSTVAP